MSAERICVRIELAEAGVAKQLISAKRNSGCEQMVLTGTECRKQHSVSVKQIQDSAECFCVAKHADTFNADNQAMIKRIIFLKTREVGKFQTTPKLYSHSLFQIYPSGYTV